MVFEKIEALKKQWTDKYVVVDASRPELRRFDGQTGKVKTVNMSGRALVEFDAYANIGWYDIDLSFLKQVDAPLPKVKEEKHKPEAKATPSTVKPVEKGATKPAPATRALSRPPWPPPPGIWPTGPTARSTGTAR